MVWIPVRDPWRKGQVHCELKHLEKLLKGEIQREFGSFVGTRLAGWGRSFSKGIKVNQHRRYRQLRAPVSLLD